MSTFCVVQNSAIHLLCFKFFKYDKLTQFTFLTHVQIVQTSNKNPILIHLLFLNFSNLADSKQWGLHQHRAQGFSEQRKGEDFYCHVLQPQI